MTRDEQLKFCKICKNQKFDPTKGIICSLTSEAADFTISCDSFIEDSELKIKNDKEVKEKELLESTASQGKRFTNHLIDIIFYFIFCFIFGIVLGIVLAIVSPQSLSIFDDDNKLIEYLLAFIASMIYYSTFEILTGRTPAKYITKTKVVNLNGETPSADVILVRSLCRFIPFDAFSFLSDGIGWHDKMSGTRVIEVK